ncbi:transcriptional regulatory protein DegU [bacterium BMS3Abin02]|nr:transcriptional regulatory protein DegU [bacterium BMS3Abin02]GBE22079.1 transcriptional regulatory protein DegU [bacterium BMS3Bbin01]HDH24605.1 response regulator transcription factor [Actinomycetota bacterium]HDL49225.1 response regulator transcription factor [Actinomycetota bacterium]
MRVVIADDHRIVREGLRFMLSDHPDVEIVAEAANGEELLETLATVKADIVLLDLRMPGITGLEALDRISVDHPRTKVIILSMHDDPGYVRRAVELGASGYLLKNTGRDELLRALKAVQEGGAYIQGEIMGPLLSVFTQGSEEQDTPSLSPRESQVLQLVADGCENKQIAKDLGVSEATVKTYLKNVFARLGVRSRAEAVAVGLRIGIID